MFENSLSLMMEVIFWRYLKTDQKYSYICVR